MSKHEQQLKDAFIHDLKAPDQYDALAKKLEIKRSPKHTHYMKKPFFTKPRLIVAMSSFLLLIAGFIAFSLVSVNAGVPVYKGMEVESVTQVSSAYALEEVSEPFIDEIESGLVPETTEGISYYAEQGETILVKVNMENPNNHIILSFTLNGFMYQDLDFNEGPELNGIIQIIVEFRVANASGIQNITIDAIKYIDSDDDNAIKDAIFDADRTIQVGILYDDIPEILEVSETIAATSFTLDFTLTDPSSLSVDTAFLYVFDGTNIIYTQPVSIGANSFNVSDLMMGHAYEYAITTLFDPLDGVGARLFVLNQGILETLHGVTPSVTSTQEGVSSTLVTLEGVSITTVSLYLNDTLISNITETNNAYVLEDLLSNTTYELRTTYTYTFNGSPLTQTSIESFTTDAKDIPNVKVLSAVSFGNLVFSTFRVTDVDDTITDLEVRLYKDGDLVQTLDNVTLTPQVANPGTFNASVNLTYSGIGDYLIVVVYTYDLNEGDPLVTVDSLDMNADHTLRYEVTREIPELTLNGDSTVTIEVYSTYTELGATFDDSKDGTGDALISGDTVNTNIVGTYTVLYNYTDTDNNRATQLSRIVNVVDTTAPVITLNGNAEITIEAGAPYNKLGATVTDNYDPDNVAVVGGDTVDTTTLGTYTITYNFTDVNGNAAIEVIRTVTIVDTTAPLITIDGGNTMTLEYLDTFVEPVVTVTDNLDDTRTINGTGTVDTSTLGTYTITYNTTDTEGNVAVEVTLTVTVVDTTAPVITLSGDADITLQAGATYTELGAVVTDNYDADDIAIISGDTVDTSTLGTYEVTYNFTDSNNNVAVQVTRTVTVIDTTTPIITLTGDADITIQAGSLYTDQGAIFSDNLDTTGTITIVGDTIDTSILGENTITYNATDSEGNVAAEVTRTVTVIDTTAPVITLTGDADITIEAGATYNELGAIVTDNYDPDNVAIVGGDTVDTSTLGTYTITYNATDSEGNVAIEVTRRVTVIDTTAPVITLIGDATVNIEVDSTYTESGALVTDNYDADDVAVVGGDTVDTSTLGTYEVTYNFTDSNNNVAVEVTRTINVVDTTPPVITLNGDATVNIEVGSTYTELGAVVTDNYDPDNVAVIDGDIVDTSILNTYEVTYFFTDSSNNNAVVVTRTVNVVDTTAPVMTNESLISDTDSFTITTNEHIDSINLDDAGFTSITATTSHTLTSLSEGNHTIILRDPSGNVSSTYTILIDTTQPVLSSSTTNAYQSVDDYDFNVGINEYLGYSGGLGSDFAVVGSTHNKVYIYDLTKSSGDQYYETIITSVSDSRYTTVFGDYIIISSERHSSSAGVVIMYKLTRDINNNITGVTSVFTQNGNPSAGYGKSTAVDGDYLIVGAWLEKRVYVYEFIYTNGDITGIQQLFYLETQDTVSLYGFEVDIYGNYVAVGTASNRVYLYEITDFSTPTFSETMISTPVGSNFFGRSLTLDNYKLVVGAYLSNLNGNNSGSAYIFNDVRSLTTSSGSVVHDAELLGHNAGESFGYSVKLYGDILLVGATEEYSFQGGKVYIYDLSLSSSHDNYESAIDSSEAGTAISSEGLFGNFVSYNGTYVLVGAGYNHLYGNFDNGSAHLFRKQPGFVFTVNETNVDTQTLTLDTVSTAISNNLFYNTEGTYQFIVTDTAGNTTTLNYIYDVTTPVITLNGASSITLTVGDTYTESGANVTDNIYPDDVAVITGTVNTSVAGTYTINYDYTDGSGNDAVRVTRTVIVQSAPGTQNNPNQISTTQEFIDYFNSDRQLLNNFNKEYFILMNDLDFQNAQLPELELRGHLDGQNYTIANAQTYSNSSSSNIGFFENMQSASLKNITFNNITSNNSTAYTSTRKAGLLFGAIDASSGTSVIDNITISNSNLIYTSTLRGEVGLIAGQIKNADISNITLSNNNLEYRSTYTAQEHWYVGFMFGSNGGVVTMSDISGSGNKLYQSQGNNSTNAPGVIIGYALAREVYNSYVTLSNLDLSVNIYLKTTGSRSRWWFGYYGDTNTSELVSSSVSITTTILNITNY